MNISKHFEHGRDMRNADGPIHSPAVSYDISDSENENQSDNENEKMVGNNGGGGGDASVVENELRTPRTPMSPPPFMQMQFPRSTRYFFPASSEFLDSSIPGPPANLNQSNHLTSQITQEANLLESSISQIKEDLERFASPPESPCVQAPTHHPNSDYTSPVVRANQRAPFSSSQSDSTPRGTCTSISMLIHSSMENPNRLNGWQDLKRQKRGKRSHFTATQQMQEDLYESLGEKPSNLTDENQLLYQMLDYERKKLILRKGLSNFISGALKRQGEKVERLESRNKMKSEECAARLIFHTLLLRAYRKLQEHVTQLLTENIQHQKSVENLCLQLRVVRHLQTAEKERAIEKAHEIGSLKTEMAYIKKILNKSKTENSKVVNDCEVIQRENDDLVEAKYKLQREVRILEDKKEILEGSLEMEKKRSEKHIVARRTLKRQLTELRNQIADLTTQSDKCQERSREFEAKNWELQILLESRGKEFISLGRNRDMLKAQADELQQTNLDLSLQNDNLEVQIKILEKESQRVKQELDAAGNVLRTQCRRIMSLEDEIGHVEKESLLMRDELVQYKLVNIRRRRAAVNLVMTLTDPLETMFRFFIGAPRRNEFITWNR